MAFFGNLEGTLRNLFTIGKNANEVGIRSNAGVLEGKNNGGSWAPLISATALESKTANFTAAFGKLYLTTNVISVQLPAPVLGGEIKIKKIDGSVVTLLRDGAEKIETVAANYDLTSTRQSVTLISNGTDWFII